MELAEMTKQANDVAARYRKLETAKYGREWSNQELMLGFMGDVGDLAKLVQGMERVRPRADLPEALDHELADCLWSVLVLASVYGRDLEAAFTRTMSQLHAWLDEQEVS